MTTHFTATLLCVLSTYFGVITSTVMGSEDSAAILVPSLIDTKEGELPKSWEGSDVLSIRKSKGRDSAWIEASSKGRHEMKSPKFDISADFDLALSVELNSWSSDSGVNIALETENGEAMKLSLSPSFYRKEWAVSLEESSKRVAAEHGKPVPVRLRREGQVYSVIVDGKVAISRRMSQFTDFSRLRIELSGPETDRGHGIARVHSIVLKAKGQ